jgi:hypothetical protein
VIALVLTAGLVQAADPVRRPLAAQAWWPAVAPSDPWAPVGVLRLPGDIVLIADRYQNRIFRLKAPDRPPGRLPEPNPPAVEWTALSAAPGLSFFALDGPGRFVQQFDFRGNYQGTAIDLERMAAEEGLGGIDPAGFAVDRSGRAIVTDRFGDRLLEFGPGWSFLGVWGQSGDELGSWRRPGSVAVGKRPPFLVADEGNRRVVLVDEFGEAMMMRRLFSTPVAVAVLAPSRYAVAFADTVEILDGTLHLLERVVLPKSDACRDHPFATAALAGDENTLFVGDGCTGRVLELRRSGK